MGDRNSVLGRFNDLSSTIRCPLRDITQDAHQKTLDDKKSGLKESGCSCLSLLQGVGRNLSLYERIIIFLNIVTTSVTSRCKFRMK